MGLGGDGLQAKLTRQRCNTKYAMAYWRYNHFLKKVLIEHYEKNVIIQRHFIQNLVLE